MARALSNNHAVNGGGDVQAAGRPAPDRLWRVGIADPRDNSRVLTSLEGSDFAIATSGTAERGLHIINPATGQPVQELASITVVGTSLTEVDVAATAAFVHGTTAINWLQSHNLEGIAVALDGTVTRTPGLPVAPTVGSGRPRLVEEGPSTRAES